MTLYKKTINGNPYWYLREMARVDGKPKMVSERYLGTAADIEALLDAKESVSVPERPGTWVSGTAPRPSRSCSAWMLPGSSTPWSGPGGRTPAPRSAPTWPWSH